MYLEFGRAQGFQALCKDMVPGLAGQVGHKPGKLGKLGKLGKPGKPR